MQFEMIQVIAGRSNLAFFCIKNTMWILLVAGVLILVLILLLFIPIQLYVNTTTNQYFARVGYLAKANLEGDKTEIIRVRMRVLGYPFFLYPLKMKKRRKHTGQPQKKTRGKRQKAGYFFKVLKAFELKKFELHVDTGNCITNAKLYPVFGFVNHHFASCQINYIGINYLIMDIRSRPLTLLKSFIHF